MTASIEPHSKPDAQSSDSIANLLANSTRGVTLSVLCRQSSVDCIAARRHALAVFKKRAVNTVMGALMAV